MPLWSEVKAVPITWVPTGQPGEIAQVSELEDPWSDPKFGAQTVRKRSWSVNYGELNGVTTELYSTPRYISSIEWKGDEIQAAVKTNVGFTVQGKLNTRMSWGEVGLDPVSRETKEYLEITGWAGPLPRSIRVFSQPGANGFAEITPDSSIPFPKGFYSLDQISQARKLNGLGDISAVQMLSAGNVLLTTRRNPDSSRFGLPDYIYMHEGDTRALVISHPVAFAMESRPARLPRDHENGRSLFYLQPEDGECCELAIFDPAIFQLIRVGKVPPLKLGESLKWEWTDPTRADLVSVLIDDRSALHPADVEWLLNIKTAELEAPPPVAAPSTTAIGPSIYQGLPSPTGRYKARVTGPEPQARGTSCATRPWVTVDDRVSGNSKTVFECKDGFDISLLWLDETHLLITQRDDCCERTRYTNALVDVMNDGTRLLSDHEYKASPVISPDKTKLMLGNATLRIYSSAGTLVREVKPPAGSAVQSAIWSSDGKKFSYILGPEDNWAPPQFEPNP